MLRRVDLDNYCAVQGVTLMLMQTAACLVPAVVDMSFILSLLTRFPLVDIGSGAKKTCCGAIFL